MPLPIVSRIALWTWLFAALAIGRFELLSRIPPPAIQGILFLLTGALIVAYRLGGQFRGWVDGLDVRAIVLFHVTRFVGLYFIYLYRHDLLPYGFAVPGGLGDISVAVLALVVAFAPFSDALRQRAISIWNVIGTIDILLVVFTAARLGLTGHAYEMRALTFLPLSLLPTFLVPLIIASHVAIFARLRRADI